MPPPTYGGSMRSRSTARISGRRSCCSCKRALGLPIVGGSDAHHWLQLGVRHSLVHTDELTLGALTKTIREGLTGYAAGPYTALRVKTAKSLKRIIKLLRKGYGGLALRRAALGLE